MKISDLYVCVWPADALPKVRPAILIPLFNIIFSLMFLCLVLSLFLSYSFLLLSHSPDCLFPITTIF